MNGYKIVLLKAILCFIGCRKVNGYAPEYVMHRNYDSNAPIQFYEYDDRIEIQNPGGLYGKVSPINFPNVSDYRPLHCRSDEGIGVRQSL